MSFLLSASKALSGFIVTFRTRNHHHMNRFLIFTVLLCLPLHISAAGYEIICISGTCNSSIGHVLSPGAGLSLTERITAGSKGCRLVLLSTGTNTRLKLNMQPNGSIDVSSIESMSDSPSVSVSVVDMKTEYRYSDAISRLSTGEAKRGSDFGTADYSVALSLISKCAGEVFSIDSLYKKTSDHLFSIGLKTAEERDMITVSNYEDDSLFVAVYGIRRNGSIPRIERMGELWTIGVAPNSDLNFFASDTGETDYSGFFAVSSKEDFNYIDTFNALETAEGIRTETESGPSTGFSIINKY